MNILQDKFLSVLNFRLHRRVLWAQAHLSAGRNSRGPHCGIDAHSLRNAAKTHILSCLKLVLYVSNYEIIKILPSKVFFFLTLGKLLTKFIQFINKILKDIAIKNQSTKYIIYIDFVEYLQFHSNIFYKIFLKSFYRIKKCTYIMTLE